MKKALLISAIALAASTWVPAQPFTEAEARKIIAPLYANFTMPVKGDTQSLLEQGTTQDWQSCTGEDAKNCRSREVSAQVFAGFGQSIPNMKHEIKEMIVADEKTVVRGELTGTPFGEFYGVPHSGKSFRIMTVDIQTIKGGKVAKTNHLEDWASALNQLRAK